MIHAKVVHPVASRFHVTREPGRLGLRVTVELVVHRGTLRESVSAYRLPSDCPELLAEFATKSSSASLSAPSGSREARDVQGCGQRDAIFQKWGVGHCFPIRFVPRSVTMSRSAPVRTSGAVVSSFVERSVSATTRETYRRTVREFQRFLGRRSVVAAGPDDGRRWRNDLAKRGQRPATIARALATVRSLSAYLEAGGYVLRHPASAKLVLPPELRDDKAGRALTPKDVRHLLCGPNRAAPDGARDYAILLALARLGLRVSELCALRVSSLWKCKRTLTLTVKVKRSAEREVPVPDDVREAITDYLRLGAKRRPRARSGGDQAFVFQPIVNYRTLEFDRPLTRRHVLNIVSRWAAYCGIGKLSPHDLRRTAITRALELGMSYYEVQLMSGHRDPKTVQRYDHRRNALEQSAINKLHYDE